MTTKARRPRMHGVLGTIALACLVWFGFKGSSWGIMRVPAVVEAGRVFSLSVLDGGRVQWNVRDGRRPGGSSLVSQLVQAYDGVDRVELSLEPGVISGQSVSAGQMVASLRSVRQESQLAEQRAERALLLAQQHLLLAGGRPDVIAETERNLAVVRARRDASLAELNRARVLVEQGLISTMELEKLRISDDVNRLQIDQAVAAVEVARAAPRAEEIAVLDARIDALDAVIREAETLFESTSVLAPIDGVVHVGQDTAAIDILDLRIVYLAVAVPVRQRPRISTGTTVRFAAATAPQAVRTGTLVEISEETVLVRGTPSVWASVFLDNKNGELVAGMTGTVEIEASRSPWLYLGPLGQSLLGSLS